MIDSSSLASAIHTQIAGTVERSVQEYVENIVRTLAMDQDWITKMERQINDEISRRFGARFSLVDVNTLVGEAIGPAVEQYFQRQRTAGHGIKDFAQSTELTAEDGSVSVANRLSANSLKVQTDAEVTQTMTVKDLVVKGTINTDNRSWQELSAAIAQQALERLTKEWHDNMINAVTQEITNKGINFDRVTVDGQVAIDGDSLANTIRRSNLTQLGVLDSVKVSGDADFYNSLAVRNRRVGINTAHPEMALAIWDEEVALIFGKHQEQTAYFGTLKPQSLVIGVNRAPAITVDDKGHVAIRHLTVGRHRFCHEPECPNYSGTKGDIVFNSNPKNDGVWGWQCLGAFRWVPLRTS